MWREKDGLLGSVPSVGEQLALTLLAHLPELGVALFNRYSGNLRGKTLLTGADVPKQGPPSIWELWQPAATTRSFATSTGCSWWLVNPRRGAGRVQARAAFRPQLHAQASGTLGWHEFDVRTFFLLTSKTVAFVVPGFNPPESSLGKFWRTSKGLGPSQRTGARIREMSRPH